MKNNLVIILFLISMKSFACTCGIKRLYELQKYELENSECIFIGEVIEVNDSDLTFKIKVTESLDDGDSIGNIARLIFQKVEDGFLRLNMCGISRSFDYPIVNPLSPAPEMLEKKITEKEKENLIKKIQIENMKIALSDLELEIIALRIRRDDE